MMRSGLRTVLSRHAPRALALLRAVRSHRRFTRQYRTFQRDLAQRLWPDGDIRVLAGPFTGMRYIDATVHGCIAPHWIGSAECELHDDIETLIARGPGQIVNIGSAEGYYAVGLAKRLPHARVAAFESRQKAAGPGRDTGSGDSPAPQASNLNCDTGHHK